MIGAAPAGLSTVVAATFAVTVPGVVVAAAGAAFGSVSAWSGAPTCPESACELAAIAAAAIASGGVEPPEEGVAAGTFAGGAVTGMTTATGFGVVAVRAACWARTVEPTVDVS
ncbi:MAG TPA: hypothetical protein VKS24_18030 [Bradyrhizobium sp.]|nr:hypothetical protein [Bradyrhizobium sp.]